MYNDDPDPEEIERQRKSVPPRESLPEPADGPGAAEPSKNAAPISASLPETNGAAASGPVSPTVAAANGELVPAQYPANLPPGIPTRMEQIMDLIGEGKTIWDALVTVFGLHDASYKYLILERTRLTKEEANVVSDAIFVAEHGIGVPPFDFPIPGFADWVVSKLHAFISVDGGKGNARDEFREIASSWVASLRAKSTMLSQNLGGAGLTNAAVTDKGVPGSEP